MSPVDGVTLDEAAQYRRLLASHLGPSYRCWAAACWAGQPIPKGVSGRCRVLALGSRSSRVAFEEVSSYWVGATTAAELLGVGVARLIQFVVAERIPFEVHTDGRRIYRREQLLTVANARDARWHGRA